MCEASAAAVREFLRLDSITAAFLARFGIKPNWHRMKIALIRRRGSAIGGAERYADRLMRAIERVTADPVLHTPDLGGQATTKAVTAAVCAALRRQNG